MKKICTLLTLTLVSIIALSSCNYSYKVTKNGKEIYNYDSKATATETEKETETETETKPETEDTASVIKSPANTQFYIDDDTKTYLYEKNQSDYKKVKWGVVYQPVKDIPGLIFSVAPFVNADGKYSLIVGITNAYKDAITVSATASPKGKNGVLIGNKDIYVPTITAGNTYICKLDCTDVPTGEIKWENIKVDNSLKQTVSWDCDWAIGTDNDGYAGVFYKIYASDGVSKFVAEDIWALILDDDGNVLDIVSTYKSDETTSIEGFLTNFDKEIPTGTSDVAIFVSTHTK